MQTKVLLVDMDGTLADLTGAVLDSDGNFHIDAMQKILTDETAFMNLKPFQNMIDAIKMVIHTHPEIDVKILSTAKKEDPPGIPRQKNKWLDIYLPEVKREDRWFVAPEISKSDVFEMLGKDNELYLIDDYNKNLVEFADRGGYSIKCRNYYNGEGRGAYGGDFGNVWDSKIRDKNAVVFTYDAPEKIFNEIETLMAVKHIEPQINQSVNSRKH